MKSEKKGGKLEGKADNSFIDLQFSEVIGEVTRNDFVFLMTNDLK